MKAQEKPSEPLLATIEESCSMLRIGRTKLYELIANGHIDSVLIGRARRAKVSSLIKFAEEGTGYKGRPYRLRESS